MCGTVVIDRCDLDALASRANAARRAISWYKSSAGEYIRRMHAMCRVSNEHGIVTEMITSVRPGYVVFEDEHPVAAEPFAPDGDLTGGVACGPVRPSSCQMCVGRSKRINNQWPRVQIPMKSQSPNVGAAAACSLDSGHWNFTDFIGT
jgi:hypothetical protein